MKSLSIFILIKPQQPSTACTSKGGSGQRLHSVGETLNVHNPDARFALASTSLGETLSTLNEVRAMTFVASDTREDGIGSRPKPSDTSRASGTRCGW